MENPSPTSVYRFYDGNGVLLYVGITSRRIKRQFEHNGDKEWWPFVQRQEVEHFDSRQLAAKREVALIRHFRPPFNIQHNLGCETTRLAYLAYRDAAEPHADPSRLVVEAGREIPLSLVSDEAGTIEFRTSPIFASVASRLVKAPSKVGLSFGSNFGGQVRAIELEGPSARIVCTKRVPFTAGESPFARVKIINSRDGGGVRFHVHSVQACSPDERRQQKLDMEESA